MIKVCLYCKKEFRVKPGVVRRGGGKYCSHVCRGFVLGFQPVHKVVLDKVDISVNNGVKKLLDSGLIKMGSVGDEYRKKYINETRMQVAPVDLISDYTYEDVD